MQPEMHPGGAWDTSYPLYYKVQAAHVYSITRDNKRSHASIHVYCIDRFPWPFTRTSNSPQIHGTAAEKWFNSALANFRDQLGRHSPQVFAKFARNIHFHPLVQLIKTLIITCDPPLDANTFIHPPLSPSSALVNLTHVDLPTLICAVVCSTRSSYGFQGHRGKHSHEHSLPPAYLPWLQGATPSFIYTIHIFSIQHS